MHIVAPDQRFQAWDYEKVARSRGGAVYIDVEPDGSVAIHKGLLPINGKRRDDAGASCGNPATIIDAPERPELSAPLTNYIELVRHSAVRLAVAQSPGIAVRLALAQLIGGSRLWSVEPERQTPYNAAIAKWRDAQATQQAFDDQRRAVLDQFGLDRETLAGPDASGETTQRIFGELLNRTDTDVLSLLALVVAETLAMGTGMIDVLGQTLKVDVGASWQPDELFFDLAKDREAVGAMLEEVIGQPAARPYITENGSKKKAIFRKAQAGEDRAKVEGWLPRYFRFPQAGYTDRPLTAGRA